MTATPEELAAAAAWLRAHPAVDTHAHPGRAFVRAASKLSLPLRLYAALGTFQEKTPRDMIAGGSAVPKVWSASKAARGFWLRGGRDRVRHGRALPSAAVVSAVGVR